MSILYAAFDPGATNGWATFALPNIGDGYQSGQVPLEHLWDYLETMRLSGEMPKVLLYEKFRSRVGKPAANLLAVEAIGIIKEWTRQNKVQAIGDYGPDITKFFWTDERLKEYGLFAKGRPHANDAMRLLCHYLYFVLGTEKIKKG